MRLVILLAGLLIAGAINKTHEGGEGSNTSDVLAWIAIIAAIMDVTEWGVRILLRGKE